MSRPHGPLPDGPLPPGKCIKLPPRWQRPFRKYVTAARVMWRAYRATFPRTTDIWRQGGQDFRTKMERIRAEQHFAAAVDLYTPARARQLGFSIQDCKCPPGLGHNKAE